MYHKKEANTRSFLEKDYLTFFFKIATLFFVERYICTLQRGCRIMAITLAFQAGDVGSIPIIR